MLATFWKLLEDSWYFYGKNMKRFLPGICMIFVLTFILPVIKFIYAPSYAVLAQQEWMFIAIFSTVVFILTLLSFYVTFAFFRIIHARIVEQEISWKKAFTTRPMVFLHTLLVSIIVAGATALGSMFLIIPGLILFVYLFFSQYYALFEGEKTIEALKKGWNLVRGRWWVVAGRLLLPILLIGVLQYLLIEIMQAVAIQPFFSGQIQLNADGTIPDPSVLYVPVVLIGIIRSFVTAVFYPWFYGVTMILFEQLKRVPHA